MKKAPKLIVGEINSDSRGTIFSNNSWDISKIKRVYKIKNINNKFVRGWKGHKIENRWFLCSKGNIKIFVVKISDLNRSSTESKIEEFDLTDNNMNTLFVPSGYATAIKQNIDDSEVIAFSDYFLGESNDENLRFEYKNYK